MGTAVVLKNTIADGMRGRDVVGLHVDGFMEFGATVDSFIRHLQPGMESQYAQDITQFVVAHIH